MKRVVCFVAGTVALMLVAGGMLIAAIVAANQIGDEKIRYFVIGYYVALHHDLVRWVWKKLRARKDMSDPRCEGQEPSRNSPTRRNSP